MKPEIYDLAMPFNESKRYYDLEFENGDLKTTNSYTTSLLLTYGVDARASSGLVANDNRGGWWGNLFNTDRNSAIGSQLWIIANDQFTEDNKNRGKAILDVAFGYYVTAGIAKQVNITASMMKNGYKYDIELIISDSIVESQTFKLWQNTKAET